MVTPGLEKGREQRFRPLSIILAGRMPAVQLPDQTGIRPHHFGRGLASPCFCKLRHIRHRSVYTPAGCGMRVAKNLRSLGLGRRFSRPNLGPSEEKSLLGSKTVDVFGL